MARDPYDALGVQKTAAQDDIRKAYRALAKKFHPDLNPGDSSAADRFKEISAAYDIVGDPDKRKRFDAGEIDASGAERPQYETFKDFADAGGRRNPYASQAGYQDFEDVSDIFADLFGQRARAGGGERGSFKLRGQDVRYHLAVDFLDAVRGSKTRVTMPDGKSLDIAIPEGTRDGQTLRLKGQGSPGLGGGPPGDAFVEVEVRPHPRFERTGDDILVEVPISIDEAVLGGKIEVPTLAGRANLTVPAGSSSGRTLRLKGKGARRAGGGHGDQLVKLRIVLPQTIDPELQRVIKDWAAKHYYDPRAAGGGS